MASCPSPTRPASVDFSVHSASPRASFNMACFSPHPRPLYLVPTLPQQPEGPVCPLAGRFLSRIYEHRSILPLLCQVPASPLLSFLQVPQGVEGGELHVVSPVWWAQRLTFLRLWRKQMNSPRCPKAIWRLPCFLADPLRGFLIWSQVCFVSSGFLRPVCSAWGHAVAWRP